MGMGGYDIVAQESRNYSQILLLRTSGDVLNIQYIAI